MEYIQNPNLIEENSFIMIEEIIRQIRPNYQFKNEIEEKIIKRAIHTTADFEYLDILEIKEGVIEAITEALKKGATLYTDTTMALSGINKTKLKALGCEAKCYISDERVVKLAKEKGMTRSMAAVEVAAAEEGEKIFVIGNAPTALYKIMELTAEGKLAPAAVVGVPVGFVGAAESKGELALTTIPSITAQGRKGGSNLAAAIVNAILYAL
ncbi:cobalt-precorrin-8 methylmutase [Sporanaerobium hydrogeniformans]|uniref:Cobalt-precorrin-8 methylmutase n=1 Tax=Sporanaerobium hydrogeniformans TaxID=3072179 RepID=A0AC61DDC6_9FIRM|nr:cobalt-precorrin-8 methylmutase [Sporanaerobium hydrogeniformans]PHV70992.1 cobalt-precorrin-8 methylmutase [Sporanaerobium hydrogeniformans]